MIDRICFDLGSSLARLNPRDCSCLQASNTMSQLTEYSAWSDYQWAISLRGSIMMIGMAIEVKFDKGREPVRPGKSFVWHSSKKIHYIE